MGGLPQQETGETGGRHDETWTPRDLLCQASPATSILVLLGKHGPPLSWDGSRAGHPQQPPFQQYSYSLSVRSDLMVCNLLVECLPFERSLRRCSLFSECL